MNSPFAWPGGKRALLSTLLSLIPSHHTYVEVFTGSGKLLFAKEPSRFEILNDKNGEVTNFFRVCKHRPAELAELFESECIHGGRFRELVNSNSPDELERALRFAYLTWYSFGSKGQHFAQGSAKSPVRKPLTRVRELFKQTAQRLAPVQIETQDFSTILRRYDADTTFFYLDPPYVDFQDNGRYGALTLAERDQLFAQLSLLRAKFLLSFDDHPEIRERCLNRGLQFMEASVQYSMSGSKKKLAPELLIANYEISKREV